MKHQYFQTEFSVQTLFVLASLLGVLSVPGNAGKERYAGAVVCLIGPGTVSSGEGMAKMFSAIPGVTLIGQPTRGASGNPQPVLLPNGLVVYFSRWVDMDMKGNIVEDRGVQPKIKVKHGAGDPTFARALKMVQKK